MSSRPQTLNCVCHDVCVCVCVFVGKFVHVFRTLVMMGSESSISQSTASSNCIIGRNGECTFRAQCGAEAALQRLFEQQVAQRRRRNDIFERQVVQHVAQKQRQGRMFERQVVQKQRRSGIFERHVASK